MPLFDRQRHERLTDTLWNEDRARQTIEQIVDGTDGRFDEQSLWPIHPTDKSPERPPDSMKTLYHGAAGVLWALYYLDDSGAVALKRDYLPSVSELVQRHRADIQNYEGVRKYLGPEVSSYMMGEAGFLLLHWKLEPSEDLAQQLFLTIESKIGDPRGLAWGSSGTMLAALFMYERTEDSRWQELFLRNAVALFNQLERSEDLGCYLWKHDLYGVSELRLGALHGFAGNAFPFIRGSRLLPSDLRDESKRRIYETLNATALAEGDFINWPINVGSTTRSQPLPLFVQHCNGAPGVINCMSEFPEDARWPIDSILLRAGELVWEAGPTVKFPSLCHGAAGSGYSFLNLYTRTRDIRWLDRARGFAMHAIDQSERALREYGQRKYSLWTGDLGLAIFLWDCIRGEGKLPAIGVF